MPSQLASQSDEAGPQVLETDERATTQSPPFKLPQPERKVDTALTLQDLTSEILLQTFEYVLDGQTEGLTTLKRLRMVSKRIAAIASKPLFKTDNLDSSLHLWKSLQCLAHQSVLEQHVRVLVISIGPSFKPQPGLLTSVYFQTCKKPNTHRASPVHQCCGASVENLAVIPKICHLYYSTSSLLLLSTITLSTVSKGSSASNSTFNISPYTPLHGKKFGNNKSSVSP